MERYAAPVMRSSRPIGLGNWAGTVLVLRGCLAAVQIRTFLHFKGLTYSQEFIQGLRDCKVSEKGFYLA